MKNNRLYFYEVEDEYVEYMSKFDEKIMYTKIENRKFKRKYIGILFRINDEYYIAPLSRYKKKHEKMNETIDFLKVENKAVINLNNMFPVKMENITKIEIEKEENYNYKQLLRNEYKLCNSKFEKIVKNAKVLYEQVTIYKMPIKNRCCDFKFLEKKCEQYCNQK